MNFDQWRNTVRGVLYEWLNRPDAAISAYQASLRANPRDVRAVRSIAWLHARGQRWQEAEAWFARALDIEPESADTWFNLGYAREQLDKRDAAIEAFRRTTVLNPKHDRAWYGMGMVHAHQGDHAAAAEALTQAAKLQPMNGAAWYALGMAHHHNHAPGQVGDVVHHLVSHEPQTARRLIRDAERADLAHLVAHLED